MKNVNVHIDPKNYKNYPYDYDTRLGGTVCLNLSGSEEII
jgi:hypothetical protein